MKRVIKQFSKADDKKSGLKDIVSDIYKGSLAEVKLIFNTKSGIKAVTVGWKNKGYYYIVPLEVSKTGKNEEVICRTQDKLIPQMTITLMELGFKDLESKTKTDKTSSVKDIFNEKALDVNNSNDLAEIDFDNLEKKTTLASKNYKLGTVEILHKLFKPGNTVYWPNDVEYKKVEKAKKTYEENPNVAQVHMYKKLMGDTLVDSPLQVLKDLTISQSSFNITATGIKPIVLETKKPGPNGKYVESVQFRAKTLVQEGKVRTDYLYAELNPDTFKLLRDQEIIKETLYKQGKTYKVELGGTKGDDFPLVNPNVTNIPKDEIVDLVWDISTLKVRQTVYKRKLKELYSKTSSFTNYVKGDEEAFNESIGLNSKGHYDPKSIAIPMDPNAVGPANIQREIGISIVKFPKTDLEKSETELLDSLVTEAKGMDSLVKQKDWIEKEITDIKATLEAKVYKLSLIKHACFVNGWSSKLEYWKDEEGKEEFEKDVKAKNSYDNKKTIRYFENTEGNRRVMVDIKRIVKEL